jgi:hypothetical protein
LLRGQTISISTALPQIRFSQPLVTTPFPPERLRLEWNYLEQVEAADLEEETQLEQ